jgi:hypothetical protein
MVYYAENKYPQAHLWLTRCELANSGVWPPKVEDIDKYVLSTLQNGDFTPVTIRTNPQRARVVVSYYAEEGPSITPITLYVPPGTWEIEVSAEGYKTQTFELKAEGRDTMTPPPYVLERDEGGAAAGGAPAGGDGPGAGISAGLGGSPSGGELHGASPEGRRRTWPLWLAGGGAAVIAGGLVSYQVIARNKIDDCGDSCSNSQRDSIDTYLKLGWGLGIAGGAMLVTGGILYFSLSPEPIEKEVTVSAAPTRGGGILSFSWAR